MGARKYKLLASSAAFAVAVSMQTACGDADGIEPTLWSEAVIVDRTNQPLMMGEVLALNGAYGAGCAGRSGSWSVAVAADPQDLEHPALSLIDEADDPPCVLTLTEVVTVGDVVYTATPPLALGAGFALTASQFATEDVPGTIAFYGNARQVEADNLVNIEFAFSDNPAFSEEQVPPS